MAQIVEVSISCLCGAAKQTVALRRPDSQATPAPFDIDLCHCHACRHTTGLLCVSYAPIQTPRSLEGLVAYPDESTQTSETTLRRYFCGTCGCHVFRREADSTLDQTSTDGSWAVATGTIIGQVRPNDEPAGAADEGEKPLLRYARHVNTASTRDGSLSPFIPGIPGATPPPQTDPPAASKSQTETAEDILQAHCHCRAIRFRITRPDASSRLPRSNFPDLTTPYVTSPREVITNPADEKWWLRPPGDPSATRYLAGTCACRSCRLSSGFEVQTWAFVPRGNIFFLPPSTSSSPSSSSSSSSSTAPIPLDFATLPRHGVPLRGFESSPGVLREFCARCGATVFWHDRWRPELVDVSVGLLAADEGARAEGWLEWWRGRVSFEEDAANGREGGVASWAREGIRALGEGLRGWDG